MLASFVVGVAVSELEDHMATRLRQMLPGVEWEAEHRFHPTRRWRFDFSDLSTKIAIECEGGTWAKGRHTRGKGFEGDCEKYNQATRLGWQVYRFTRDMIMDDRAIMFLMEVYNVS